MFFKRPYVYRYSCGHSPEVTPREVLFCAVIAAFLLSIGFWIASAIGHNANKKLLKYRQAAQIENNIDEFKLALKTDVGDAFVEGDFNAVDFVQHEKLPGNWTYFNADYQKYTRHTRVVTYTVSNGKGGVSTRTRTETYWTWDTYKHETRHSKEVRFCEVKFPYKKFRFSWNCSDSKTVSNGFNRRICFTYIPTNFHASCFSTLANDTVSDGTLLHKGVSLPALFRNMTTSHAVLFFWTLWGATTIAVLVMFVLHDNEWLDD